MSIIQQHKIVMAAFSDWDALQESLRRYHSAYHSIVFIKSGAISLSLAAKNFKLQGPVLQLLYNATSVKINTERSEKIKGLYIGIPPPLLPLDLADISTVLPLGIGRARLLQGLMRENTPPYRAGKQLLLYCYLMISLYGVQQSASLTVPDSTETLEIRFLLKVNRYFKERRPVAFYARELAVSAGYLRKRIQAAYGLSPKQLLAQRLYKEAAYLLSATALPVKTIALELGFTEAGPFSAGFKKFSGLSPSAYRMYKPIK